MQVSQFNPDDIVLSAIQQWAGAVVDIGNAYKRGSSKQEKCELAGEFAFEVINKAYNYNFGNVLFKPTFTTKPFTYRPTMEGALSYFIGSECMRELGLQTDDQFPNPDKNFPPLDDGFAICNNAATNWTAEGWEKVVPDYENFTIDTSNPGLAVAQGPICFFSRWSSPDGIKYTPCVDKTFTFVPNPNGDLPLLSTHHSSIKVESA